MEARRPWYRRALRALGWALAALLLAALFYVAIVVGQPQPEGTVQVNTTQPLLPAAETVTLTSGDQLSALLAEFPAPALWAPGSLSLIAGELSTPSLGSGYGRLLTLVYQTPDGVELQAQSLYPATAAARFSSEGAVLTGEGPALAGLRTVRMEGGQSLCLVAQGEEAVYRVILPAAEAEAVAAWLQPLQLSTP